MEKTDFKFIRKIEKKIKAAQSKYQLILPNEKVLVGLSGGIDSMSLLHLLAKRRHHQSHPFIVEALHLTLEGVPNDVDKDIVIKFCEQNDIVLHQLKLKIDYSTDTRNSPCYLCSSYRRNSVFRFAADNHFSKVAFGHHMDDILETLLMNMVSQAEISTMPPLLKMRNWTFDLIRPLCLLTKDEITRYAQLHNIKPAEGNCDFETKNSRTEIGNVLTILEKINPQAKINLYNSMTNIKEDYLAQ